ncbi:hypothetical protein GTP58_13020 [Duganella sp. CY15W]|uniref:hypothetical protein n=1 Tax=Duganella sp. CY15W TaxID=2692172 RepID=UPI00136E5365|nr:hypothetical protein [Duganella sp. CY15W]MYM29244.1 hypothetical protein [Duganella sp. CY15W]
MENSTVAKVYKKAELVCIIAALCVIARLAWVMMTPLSRADFDRQRWLAAADHPEQRCAMTGDLLKRHVRLGMSKGELLALLGPSGRDGDNPVAYYLDYCQTDIDPDTVDFYFDAQGKLLRHEVKTH